jgi:hypothetical protein
MTTELSSGQILTESLCMQLMSAGGVGSAARDGRHDPVRSGDGSGREVPCRVRMVGAGG